MNNRTRLPLPEPAKPPCPRCNGWNEKWEGTYAADQVHAYSDAENAALRERVKVLEDALREYIAAADNTITCNDKDMTTAMLRFGDADKAARAALEAK